MHPQQPEKETATNVPDNPVINSHLAGVPIATDFSVSEYSIGSTESRAAARALLERKAKTRDNKDAISIFQHAPDCEPELRAMVEGTSVYARGAELCLGSDVEAKCLVGLTAQWSAASSSFRLAFGREPLRGETLRIEDVETVYRVYLGLIEQFIEAWERHFQTSPCPLRIEGENVLARRGTVWVTKDRGLTPPLETWLRVETEVYEDLPQAEEKHRRLKKTRTRAVVFAGIKNGKPKWNPAWGPDAERGIPEPQAGILGVLGRVVKRIGLE